MMWFWR